VAIRQVFASHRPQPLEGEYLFSMPNRATLSAFAVWDGVDTIQASFSNGAARKSCTKA